MIEELPQRYTDFGRELTVIINKYSIDRDLDMYDQVISGHVMNVLHALELSVRWQRNLERKNAEVSNNPSSNGNGANHNVGKSGG